MKYIFLRNLREAIEKYHKDWTRIKLEWVYPHAVGQIENQLDEKAQSPIPNENRKLFIKLIKEISQQTEISFRFVLDAFIGNRDEEQKKLRQTIINFIKKFEYDSDFKTTLD